MVTEVPLPKHITNFESSFYSVMRDYPVDRKSERSYVDGHSDTESPDPTVNPFVVISVLGTPRLWPLRS